MNRTRLFLTAFSCSVALLACSSASDDGAATETAGASGASGASGQGGSAAGSAGAAGKGGSSAGNSGASGSGGAAGAAGDGSAGDGGAAGDAGAAGAAGSAAGVGGVGGAAGGGNGGSAGTGKGGSAGKGGAAGSGGTGPGKGGGSGSGGSSAGASGSSTGEPPGQLNGIVAAHNAARASVSPPASTPIPPLTWSDTVAANAVAWAAGCNFSHNPKLGSLGLGENIYATSGSATPQAVVTSWVGESKNYNYASNSCSGVCGHYTQVVWAKSLLLGCAVKACTTGSPFGSGSWELWVCDYSPPGNYNGQKPY